MRGSAPRTPAGHRIPEAALNAIRSFVMGNFPVRIEAPSKVSLFAYDNGLVLVIPASRIGGCPTTAQIVGCVLARLGGDPPEPHW